MLTKTKIKQTKKIAHLSTQVGVILMSAVATLGMLELPDHLRGQVLVNNQPVFAFANNVSTDRNNPLLREREEIAPHYINYNVSQRTPARSGKR